MFAHKRLWRLLAVKYVRYAVLFLLVAALAREVASPLVISLISTVALCCTLGEIALRREITVLQCYGVAFPAVAYPLLFMALGLQLAFAPLSLSSEYGAVLMPASLVCGMVGSVVILRVAWRAREPSILAACAAGISLQVAAIAAIVSIVGFLHESR